MPNTATAFIGRQFLEGKWSGSSGNPGIVEVDSSEQMSTMVNLNLSTSQDYRPCAHCPPHPLYPDVLPVTLHMGGFCAICGKG